MNRATIASVAAFVVGIVPLLAFTFFSPGISSEGLPGYAALIFGMATLVGLMISALRRKWVWGLVVLQAILIGLVLYEAFSQAALYIGT
jgi:hypothetical protein